MKKGIIVRAVQMDDGPFIYSTWLRGLYYGNDWFRKIDKTSFFDKYRIVVNNLLTRSTVRVACLEDDQDVIVAYVVYSGNCLHWVYVKKDWRKLGIATALIPDSIEVVTHLTKRAAKNNPYKFDPLITE